LNEIAKRLCIGTFLIFITLFSGIIAITYAENPRWTEMTGPWETKFGGYFDKIAVDQNQGIIYVGNGIGVGIYKSIDNGETWEPINNGLPTVPFAANYFPIIDIDVSETSAETMYLTMRYRGVFKWTGTNWMKKNGKPGMGGLTRGTALFQDEYYILAIDSNDDNLIFAGTNDGPYKSIDGGKNWKPINRNFPINPLDGSRSDINEIIRASGTLYAISNEVQGHGIYKSIDDGKKWDIIWSPHIFRELKELALKTLVALIGSTLRPFTLPTIVYTCLVINSKSNVLYVGTSKEGIYKFSENEDNWFLANDGLPFDSTGYLPIECIVVDPVKPNIIYIGTWGDGVYESHNGGASWTPLNKELESSKVKSLALDSQQQIIYAATTNGLFKYALGRIQKAHPIVTSPPYFEEASLSPVSHKSLAAYYSPVLFQHTYIEDKPDKHGLSGTADYITKVNFDGNWDTRDNWPNAVVAEWLKAYVYYQVQETDTHWFVYYAIYHPRDWTNLPDYNLAEHENDMEAILVMVAKPSDENGYGQYGEVQILESMAHNLWFNYPIDENIETNEGYDDDTGKGVNDYPGVTFWSLDGTGKHPVAYIQSKGHGVFLDEYQDPSLPYLHFLGDIRDWDKRGFPPYDGNPYGQGTGIIYYYKEGEANVPRHPNDRNITYDLLKMKELWEQRNNDNGQTFDSTYIENPTRQAFNIYGYLSTPLTAKESEAHPPWAIPNKIDNPGEEYRDPVSAIKRKYDVSQIPFSEHYLNAVISSPLKISSPPYHTEDTIKAEFTITNRGKRPIFLKTVVVGGHYGSNDEVIDFTKRHDIELDIEESYKYHGTLTLAKAGNYHFFCAYQTPEDKWNTSIDLGSGLTDKDRVEDIDVKGKDEIFWPKEKIPLPKSLMVGEYFKTTIKSCEFLRGGNLQFDAVFENLTEVSATVNPTWAFFPERMPLVDNLGNSYPVFVLFPLEKRTLARDMPWEYHIIFPKLKRESGAVVLYTGTSSGFGAGTGFPQESGLDYVGPIKLEDIPTGKQSLQMISLPKTFLTDDKNWKIIVDSYQILEGRNLEFTLFVENLQEKMDKCKIADITFLVDNVNNKYYRNPLISVKTYKEFAPHILTRVYVNFPEFDERAEAVTLYLSFKSYEKINEGWIIGPLKIRT